MIYFISSFSKTPIAICSLVIGSSLNQIPVALAIACASAGAGVLITISPMDFAPNGPVGSKLLSNSTWMFPISLLDGILYCMKELFNMVPLSLYWMFS